jgi:hypothetical protein
MIFNIKFKIKRISFNRKLFQKTIKGIVFNKIVINKEYRFIFYF